MLNHITEDQFEKLRQHLIVPLAVSDILYHDLAVEAEMQYGLHLALSEIDPDSALLAIALCALSLAEKNKLKSTMAYALEKEANTIIDDYGPDWLHHHQRGSQPESFESVLETVPEDLEALADLMEALCAEVIEDSTGESATEILSNLLCIQARAHMEIADYILSEIEFEKSVDAAEANGEPAPVAEPLDMEAYKGSNIVVFPGFTTRGE